MDLLFDKYADAVIYSALEIREGDVLSINTEEDESTPFAKLLAKKAKEITGNGSYIQRLEDGKIVDNFDYLSPFPLNKKPTAFVYIPLWKDYPILKRDMEFDAPLLQGFRLLSDPLGNGEPSVPFVSCPLPGEAWDKALEDSAISSSSLLYSILELDNEDYIREMERRKENIRYEEKRLNAMELTECRIANDEGTDLTFSFLKTSRFHSSYSKTTAGRSFAPSIVTGDLFRLIDPTSLNGWLNVSRPIILFGERISSLSVHFQGGKIDEYRGTRRTEELMEIYLSEEPTAGRGSMVTISEVSNPLYSEELTLYSELDRMRCVSITVGGPKGEAVEDDDISRTVDSLISLSLPLGTRTTEITALNSKGEEVTIFSDGFFYDEEEEY